ncbi:MFS transporter [Paenibacillus sp. AN1007]|uniref:MFS transporter n=1 Tax=Paenibacillus sp. AN1007 TaxID=3151385 RepID=A0AAU8NAU3_9BACL
MKEVFNILRKEVRYQRLVTANFVSGIGDWFSSVAILSLLLQITGTGLAVGITLAARTLPFLFMGPIGGILADKMNKKVILMISDFARIFLALSLLFVNSSDTIWIAYVVTVGLVVFSALSSPARQSLIPQIVSKENLTTANAVDQSLNGINMTLGAVFGGVISAVLGHELAFVINTLTFLISGLIISTMSYDRKSVDIPASNEYQDTVGNPEQETTLWKEFRRSLMLKVIALQAIFWPIGGGAINILISVYGYQVYQEGNTGVGILYGALGFGFLISGFIASYFRKWMIQVVILSSVIEGLSHALMSQSSNLWIGAALISIATLGAGIGNASYTTLIMRTVPEQVLGRAFALSETTSNVMMALSMVGTGVLLKYFPAQQVGFWAGILIILSALTALPLLKLRSSDMVNLNTVSQ